MTDKEGLSIAEERTSLRKKLENWRKIQPLYMPGLVQYLRDLERLKPGSTIDSDRPEEARLWLPSSLSHSSRGAICIIGLSEAEEKLRSAQCFDSLTSIRNTLRLKTRMIQFKNKNVRGQHGGTRSREIIDRVHNRTKKFATRYRTARAAKLQLTGRGTWEETLRELHDSDIRSYQDPEHLKAKSGRQGVWEDGQMPTAMDLDQDDGDGINLLSEKRGRRDGTGRTRMTLSWIWTVDLHDPLSADSDDILRAEWARSRARVERATEEVALLREEMRRVLVFLDWKAREWSSKQEARAVDDVILCEGLRAYCVDQSNIQRQLAESFLGIWKEPLTTDNSDAGIADKNDDEDDEDEIESEDEIDEDIDLDE